MQNGHININTTISAAPELGVSQGIVRVVSSLENIDKPLDTPPPPTLHLLSNILHNTVSAMNTVLDSSRPRGLRLARSVSSRAIFVALE